MSKAGYHHGNLRAALTEAAVRLIARAGPQGFTLSEAAKEAGVTPAAVYRHFAGRDDLLAEVAREGYVLFADLLTDAWAQGRPTPLAAFEAVGRAYLTFARLYPGHYPAMFEAGISLNATPELAHAADRAQQVLHRAAEALARNLPEAERPPAAMFSAHVWALSHGIVELFGRSKTRAPYPPEDLLEAGIGIYLRGLGLIPKG